MHSKREFQSPSSLTRISYIQISEPEMRILNAKVSLLDVIASWSWKSFDIAPKSWDYYRLIVLQANNCFFIYFHVLDAVFPNNWISCHATGEIILYPMLSRFVLCSIFLSKLCFAFVGYHLLHSPPKRQLKPTDNDYISPYFLYFLSVWQIEALSTSSSTCV